MKKYIQHMFFLYKLKTSENQRMYNIMDRFTGKYSIKKCGENLVGKEKVRTFAPLSRRNKGV